MLNCLPGFFEQVGLHAGAHNVMSAVKVDLNKLAESTAVVVARGLCVAERLHDRIRGQHSLFHLRLLGGAAHIRKIPHRILGAHCFARA